MLKTRDGYSFEDFQYKGEKIISQRKRVPITSNQVNTFTQVGDLLGEAYDMLDSEVQLPIYCARHPTAYFYHSGKIDLGDQAFVLDGGFLSQVDIHHSVISTAKNFDGEENVPYCIVDSSIGESMMCFDKESMILWSNICKLTALNGTAVIKESNLFEVTLKGNNTIILSNLENFLISDSFVSHFRLEKFDRPLVLHRAHIEGNNSPLPIARENINKDKGLTGGLLYRTKDGKIAFSDPDLGVKFFSKRYGVAQILTFVENLFKWDTEEIEPTMRKVHEFVDKK